MEEDKELTKLEYFYEADMKIKQLMVDMAPSNLNQSSSDGLISYSDHLLDSTDEINYYFNYIMDNLYLNQDSKIVNQKLSDIRNDLINTPIDCSSLKSFYRERITDMNEEIIKGLNDNIAGFKLFSNEYPYIEQSKTVNELLHIFHHVITNNDSIHNRIKPIKEYPTTDYLPSVYRGKLMGDSLNLYNQLIEAIPGYPFEIISMDKKIIVMVRDKGHALSFEIDRDKDGGYDVRYFVPKITDVDMVNALKGIKKVPEDAPIQSGTTGQIYCKDMDEMTNDVVDIATKTPDDSYIERRFAK